MENMAVTRKLKFLKGRRKKEEKKEEPTSTHPYLLVMV